MLFILRVDDCLYQFYRTPPDSVHIENITEQATEVIMELSQIKYRFFGYIPTLILLNSIFHPIVALGIGKIGA